MNLCILWFHLFDNKMLNLDMRMVIAIAFVKRGLEANMDLYQAHIMLAMIALYWILTAPSAG